MNIVRTVNKAGTAVAVLALLVGLLACVTGCGSNSDPATEATQDLDIVEQNTPEIITPETVSSTEDVDIDEQLIHAVYSSDIETVKQLLDAGASPNAIDGNGHPVLKGAINIAKQSERTDMVALLVASGADVNALDSDGNALLPKAAADGQLEIVQLLLDAGADVNSTANAKTTFRITLIQAPALTHAVHSNHVEIVELLIASGADVNQVERANKLVALHIAAKRNNAEIVTILLENGADPYTANSIIGSETPLHFAAEAGAEEAIQALLAGGADVDIQIDQGMTPMMSAIVNGFSGSAGKSLTTLLENGADPNRLDNLGNTALHFAARGNNINAIRILIEHDASVNVQNNAGNTPLHQAAKWGKQWPITILLENGASLDLTNKQGKTPLDVAVDVNIIDILVEAGADG